MIGSVPEAEGVAESVRQEEREREHDDEDVEDEDEGEEPAVLADEIGARRAAKHRTGHCGIRKPGATAR